MPVAVSLTCDEVLDSAVMNLSFSRPAEAKVASGIQLGRCQDQSSTKRGNSPRCMPMMCSM